ncbi:MAG: hypothetical protein M3462_06115 [Chloroflexota bacterium]|nr:hypothetical protein [Chloroflexota bacterium]
MLRDTLAQNAFAIWQLESMSSPARFRGNTLPVSRQQRVNDVRWRLHIQETDVSPLMIIQSPGLFDEVAKLLGERIAIAIATGDWAGPVPGRLTAEMDERLRRALKIVHVLAQVEAQSTIRVWFAGMNPMLDDTAPAVHIADAPDHVRLAAEDFLADG